MGGPGGDPQAELPLFSIAVVSQIAQQSAAREIQERHTGHRVSIANAKSIDVASRMSEVAGMIHIGTSVGGEELEYTERFPRCSTLVDEASRRAVTGGRGASGRCHVDLCRCAGCRWPRPLDMNGRGGRLRCWRG